MSTTIRPDNLRAALDAKLAAATSQLIDLREAEQPRVTLHLNPREIVGTFLLHARSVYPIVDAFGRAQAGELQFSAWYQNWTEKLGEADRASWKRLRDRQQTRARRRADRRRDIPSPATRRSPLTGRRPAHGRKSASSSSASPPIRTDSRARFAATTCGSRNASPTTSSATTPNFSRSERRARDPRFRPALRRRSSRSPRTADTPRRRSSTSICRRTRASSPTPRRAETRPRATAA